MIISNLCIEQSAVDIAW